MGKAAGIEFAEVEPGVQGTAAVFENVASGWSEVEHVKKVEGVVDFVVAIGKTFEFALGIGSGAGSVVVNTAVTETADKNEVAFVEVHGTKAVAEPGFDVFGFEISRIHLWEVVDML